MNASCIIETRHMPLRAIIKRHMDFIPKDWHLYVFTGNEKDFALNELKDIDCNIIQLNVNKLDANEYNKILTDKDFWTVFENYNRVLIFQHDSGILREGIEEFMDWDFVGAPFKFQKHGGNGGLSLRNPKVMLDLIDKRKYHPSLGNEDVYFCNLMNQYGYNLALRDICKRFSVESIFELGSWGYHNPSKYLTPEQVSLILNQYQPITQNPK